MSNYFIKNSDILKELFNKYKEDENINDNGLKINELKKLTYPLIVNLDINDKDGKKNLDLTIVSSSSDEVEQNQNLNLIKINDVNEIKEEILPGFSKDTPVEEKEEETGTVEEKKEETGTVGEKKEETGTVGEKKEEVGMVEEKKEEVGMVEEKKEETGTVGEKKEEEVKDPVTESSSDANPVEEKKEVKEPTVKLDEKKSEKNVLPEKKGTEITDDKMKCIMGKMGEDKIPNDDGLKTNYCETYCNVEKDPDFPDEEPDCANNDKWNTLKDDDKKKTKARCMVYCKPEKKGGKKTRKKSKKRKSRKRKKNKKRNSKKRKSKKRKSRKRKN